MDELEYIMGDVSTPYGALRASHGYPKPWAVPFVEVGNEEYVQRNSFAHCGR
jgi:alpha-N-arabinofuranosidase